LQASLLARLDRPAAVREAAQIGAALGRQFSHELISAVASMPPAQLDDALAQLGSRPARRRWVPGNRARSAHRPRPSAHREPGLGRAGPGRGALPGPGALGSHAGGVACFHLGEFTAGRAYLEKALALYDPALRPSYSELLPYDMLVLLRRYSCWLLVCLGYLDQALFQRDAALDEGRRISHPPHWPARWHGPGSRGASFAYSLDRCCSTPTSCWRLPPRWNRTLSDDGSHRARVVSGGIGAYG
jgi:hypothetical protein